MKAKEVRAAWNKENMKTVGANVKKEVAEQFAAIADRRGTKPAALVREFILDTVERETRSIALPATPRGVEVSTKVAERLKEFTCYAPYNPDQLANLILTQWMDAQLETYAQKWDAKGDKLKRMQGKK